MGAGCARAAAVADGAVASPFPFNDVTYMGELAMKPFSSCCFSFAAWDEPEAWFSWKFVKCMHVNRSGKGDESEGCSATVK